MNESPKQGRLQLSTDEMRSFGYRVVDLLVDHIEALPDKPATRTGSPQEMEALLREPLPQKGSDPSEVLDEAESKVFSRIMHLDHPRFFGFIPSPSNFVSVMGDALASGFNVFAGTWLEAAGPAQVELTVVDWIREFCGLPETAGGLFTSGGSAANLTALCAARHIKLGDDTDGAVVYCSDQTHSSIDRGLRMLGFANGQLRRLPSDERFRLDVKALRQAIRDDRQARRRPFCVIANPGTTNTGAVDPLPEVAALCAEEDLWLHADGAYGTAAVFCEEGRAALTGLNQVDSLSFDPHKWLFQPYEIGCVLVRNADWLKETFHVLPEYLEDTARSAEEVNFCDYGPQLTRSFRALKLWMSLKTFGAETFADAVAHGFHLARFAECILTERPNWTVVTPAQMGIVTFRYEPPSLSASEADALNQSLVDALIEDGTAMVSSTKLRRRTVLRMCPINPRTTEEDIERTIQKLADIAKGYE